MTHILIAEDDSEICQLYSRVLTKNGYQVTGVSNGQEALDAIDKTYFDLIISDIMMPVMNGYELVQALRESGCNTPVMMITAKDAFDDKRQGFLSGTDDYMVKPMLSYYNADLRNEKRDLAWVRENAVVIHYYGKNKPWKDGYNGILDVFYKENVIE